MQPEEIREWLALWRSPGIGPSTFASLLERFGSPAAVLAQKARSGGLAEDVVRGLSAPDWDGVERDLAWLREAPNRHILTLDDAEYPVRLREIVSAPPVLFVAGRIDCLADPQVAIVGSRNPSAVGRRNAAHLASALAQNGLIVTSGLAIGIDTAAHEGALSAGGMTIAVAGHGLDRVYPASNHALVHRIIENGAWVSEFPTGVQAKPNHFPRRNRIICGLSLGVLVVEAAHQSGSLITARYALEQGRELFAVPGSIHNPMSSGCHTLIREGATLVENAEQVMQELAPLLGAQFSSPPDKSQGNALPKDETSRGLLDLMDYEPCTIDALVQCSGLTPEAVSSMLLTLELEGFVVADVCGRYARLGRTR